MRRKKDEPTKDVEVVDGEEFLHRVATDKEGEELVTWILVLLDHQPLLPEKPSSSQETFQSFLHLPLTYFVMFQCTHL